MMNAHGDPPKKLPDLCATALIQMNEPSGRNHDHNEPKAAFVRVHNILV
jgi:hypothetical protein